MTISAYTLQTTMDTIERGSLAFQYSESEIKQLIKVVGVGGGGGNAVSKMCTSGSVPGVSFLLWLPSRVRKPYARRLLQGRLVWSS